MAVREVIHSPSAAQLILHVRFSAEACPEWVPQLKPRSSFLVVSAFSDQPRYHEHPRAFSNDTRQIPLMTRPGRQQKGRTLWKV